MHTRTHTHTHTHSLEKKRVLKTIIQKATGLNVDPNIPLFVFLGRLDGQKGVDIMFEAISRMLSSGARAQVRACS